MFVPCADSANATCVLSSITCAHLYEAPIQLLPCIEAHGNCNRQVWQSSNCRNWRISNGNKEHCVSLAARGHYRRDA
jgi:hypothetical protein